MNKLGKLKIPKHWLFTALVLLMTIIYTFSLATTPQKVETQDVIFPIDATPVATLELMPNSDAIRQIEERKKEELERVPQLVHVGGEETRGGIIKTAKADIQLPADMLSLGFVVSLDCIEGRLCAPVPYYMIGRDRDYIIRVDANGEWIYPHKRTMNQDRARYLADFRFIYEALGKIPPTAETVDDEIVTTEELWRYIKGVKHEH